jgi:hypothetical protein
VQAKNVLNVIYYLINEKYWLHTLAVSAKDSPIIIVGTNSDDKKCTKSYIKVHFLAVLLLSNLLSAFLFMFGFQSVLESMRRSYASKFPSVVDFVTVSNKTGKGIKELMHLLGKVAEQWVYFSSLCTLLCINFHIETGWTFSAIKLRADW